MSETDYATRDEARAFDRYCIESLGVPGAVLMENAGRQIADEARLMLLLTVTPKVLVVAGRGNNGGDGYVAARHLALHGIATETVVLAARGDVRGDADANLRIIEAMGLAITVLDGPLDQALAYLSPRLASADLVIDGLLGTGTRGEIRDPYAAVITAINEARRRVLAIDIPSGMDADTGRPLGPTIRAAKTVTMAAMKAGFRQAEAEAYTGEVVVADIGVPWRRVT
jgi:NAD(P)H-hydrate epimerase